MHSVYDILLVLQQIQFKRAGSNLRCHHCHDNGRPSLSYWRKYCTKKIISSKDYEVIKASFGVLLVQLESENQEFLYEIG